MYSGLEPFCQEPEVLKKFESMASGKILLAEILERGPVPLVVLYDTSHDDDVNINAVCVKSLQDKTLASPLQVLESLRTRPDYFSQLCHSLFKMSLQVNSAYMNVSISSVCSDGTIYCQLPSRGLAKLTEILEKIEIYFHSQVHNTLQLFSRELESLLLVDHFNSCLVNIYLRLFKMLHV